MAPTATWTACPYVSTKPRAAAISLGAGGGELRVQLRVLDQPGRRGLGPVRLSQAPQLGPLSERCGEAPPGLGERGRRLLEPGLVGVECGAGGGPRAGDVRAVRNRRNRPERLDVRNAKPGRVGDLLPAALCRLTHRGGGAGQLGDSVAERRGIAADGRA